MHWYRITARYRPLPKFGYWCREGKNCIGTSLLPIQGLGNQVWTLCGVALSLMKHATRIARTRSHIQTYSVLFLVGVESGWSIQEARLVLFTVHQRWRMRTLSSRFCIDASTSLIWTYICMIKVRVESHIKAKRKEFEAAELCAFGVREPHILGLSVFSVRKSLRPHAHCNFRRHRTALCTYGLSFIL